MPLVRFSSSLGEQFTGGLKEIEVEADTVRGMIRELDARFPGLGEFIEMRAAVAIDGVIHQSARGAAIGPESEIYLIPRIGGG